MSCDLFLFQFLFGSMEVTKNIDCFIYHIKTSQNSKRLFTFLLHRYIADPSDHFSGQLTTPFGIE
jgi:hypothetical protein